MMLPDGFIGSVMAIESFSDMKALLHGPIGCRRDLGFIASSLCPKEPKAKPGAYRIRYYDGNPRIPCTEVDGEDYIGGAIRRLDDALDVVTSIDDDRIGIINTPGVSLIGENCDDLIRKKGLQEKVLALDADYISAPVGVGYDQSLLKLLKWLGPVKTESRKGKVNLIGLSVFTRDWRGVVDDLRQLLSALGLDIMCLPGTGCSLDEFKDSVNAEFNIAVCSEYCQKLKGYYAEMGVDTVDVHEAPVGFDSLRRWVKAVAERCGADPLPALEIIDDAARRAYLGMRAGRGTGNLRGKSFAVCGDSTIVLPMVEWVYRYVGLVPTSIRLADGPDETAVKRLEEFLNGIGCSDALGRPVRPGTYVVAGDGDTVYRMELGRFCEIGLDIGYPTPSVRNFVRKNVIGHNGALYLLEKIVNGS